MHTSAGGRRNFLGTLGTVGTALVAGCLGTDPAGDLDTETATDELCRTDVPTARYDLAPLAFTFVAPAEFDSELDVRPTFGVFGDLLTFRGDYRLQFSISQGLTPVSAANVEKGMESGPSVPADRVTFFHDFAEYDGLELDGFHYASNDLDNRPYPEIFWIPFRMPSGDVRYLQCEMGLSITPLLSNETLSDACLIAQDRLRTGFFESLEPNTDTTVATLF